MTTTPTEIEDAFKIVRGLVDHLEQRFTDGQGDLAKLRTTLVKAVGILAAHSRPPLKAGNRPRGLGYDVHEALIMASLPDYGGSIEKAARAHWEGEDEDMVDAKIRRLYRHKKEIDDSGMGGDFSY